MSLTPSNIRTIQKTFLTSKILFFIWNFKTASYLRNLFFKSYYLCHIIMLNEKPHKLTIDDILLLNEERLRFVKIAQRYVGKRDIAEDIYQDSIIKILNRRDEIEVKDIRSYFLIVIKNRCLDHLKSRVNRDSLPAELKELAIEDMKLLSDSGENDYPLYVDLPVLLSKVKENLSELSYEIFTAKKLSRMSAKEIAKEFGVSERKVNFEIQRASKLFRKVFKDYFVLFVVAVMTYY